MRLFNNVSFEKSPSSACREPDKKAPYVLPPDEEAESLISIEGITTDDLIDVAFQGIDLVTYTGEPFSRTLLATAINSAIDIAEQTFDIVIRPIDVVDELHDYEGESFANYQYTPVYKRPIMEVKEMKYIYGNKPLMKIPHEWIQVSKNMGDITIFPTSGSLQPILPAIGTALPIFFNRNYMPMAVSVSYRAGMERKDIPTNLLVYIFKLAAIDIFQVWGDQIIGAGIASSSLSIDGLSQSIGTTQSAMYGGASARILEYRKDIETLTPILRRHFAKFNSVVL